MLLGRPACLRHHYRHQPHQVPSRALPLLDRYLKYSTPPPLPLPLFLPLHRLPWQPLRLPRLSRFFESLCSIRCLPFSPCGHPPSRRDKAVYLHSHTSSAAKPLPPPLLPYLPLLPPMSALVLLLLSPPRPSSRPHRPREHHLHTGQVVAREVGRPR